LSETLERAKVDAVKHANRLGGVLKGKKGDSAHGLLARKWLQSFDCGNGKAPARHSLLF